MSRKRWLFAWGVGSVATGAASLLIPLYVVELGGNPFELGLLGAVSAFVGAPGGILWGRLADETSNPRAVTLASLVGVGGLLAVMPLVSSIPLLIVMNALVWLVSAAAGPVLTLLVVADLPESAWNHEIAVLNTYQGYGWAGGLLLGILWSVTVGRTLQPTATQRSLFAVCGVVAVVSAALLGRWMPSPDEEEVDGVGPRRVARALSTGRRRIRATTFLFNPNRLYWSTRQVRPQRLAERFTPTLVTYYLGVALFFTGFSVFFAPLPLYLTGLGFSSDLVYAMYLVASLGSAAFYTGAGSLAGEFDLRLLQSGALGLRGLLLPLVAVAGASLAGGIAGVVTTAALFLGIGVAWAVIAVTAGTIVTRVAPSSVRGEALGLYAALSAGAGGVGSILGGAIADDFGFTPAFVAAGVLVLSGAGLVLALRGLSERTTMTADGPPGGDGRRSSAASAED